MVSVITDAVTSHGFWGWDAAAIVMVGVIALIVWGGWGRELAGDAAVLLLFLVFGGHMMAVVATGRLGLEHHEFTYPAFGVLGAVALWLLGHVLRWYTGKVRTRLAGA